jgi:hypothetical protein
MNKKPWHGIMKVLEVSVWDNNQIIRQEKNILNMFHNDGERFLLEAAFVGGQVSSVIPENYFLGLDNRAEVLVGDDMSTIYNGGSPKEPIGSGYQRQSIGSENDFSINFVSDHYVATSPIVSFQATTADWITVYNLFLTDQNTYDGYLIATAVLSAPLTVAAGQIITVRIGMQLKDC